MLVAAMGGLGVGACGGEDGEEDQVREAVEVVLASDDPRGCELKTDRFLRNTETEDDLRVALRDCRADERDDSSEGLEPPDSADVSDVEIDREEARAKVTLLGGDLDRQEVDVALVNEEGDWKVDLLEGIEFDDELRVKFDRWFVAELGREQGPRFAECAAEGLREALPNARVADLIEGRLESRTFDGLVEPPLRACASLLEGNNGA